MISRPGPIGLAPLETNEEQLLEMPPPNTPEEYFEGQYQSRHSEGVPTTDYQMNRNQVLVSRQRMMLELGAEIGWHLTQAQNRPQTPPASRSDEPAAESLPGSLSPDTGSSGNAGIDMELVETLAFAASAAGTEQAGPPRPPTLDLHSLEYEEPYDENLDCPICRTPLVEPVVMRCKHVFCRGCICESMHHSINCPIDRKRMCSSVLETRIPMKQAHLIIRNQLDNLKVKCPNRRCEHICARALMQSHVDNDCPFAEVPCPDSNCNKLVSRLQSDKSCLHREVDCDYCGQHVDLASLHDHHDTNCSGKEIRCEHCHVLIPRRDHRDHAVNCSQREECKFKLAGCAYKTETEESLGDHEKVCLYGIVLRLDTYHVMQMEAIRGELRETQARVRQLEAEKASTLAQTQPVPSSSTFLTSSDAALETLAPAGEASNSEEKLEAVLATITTFDARIQNVEKSLGEFDGLFARTIANDIKPLLDLAVDLQTSFHSLTAIVQRSMLHTARRSTASAIASAADSGGGSNAAGSSVPNQSGAESSGSTSQGDETSRQASSKRTGDRESSRL